MRYEFKGPLTLVYLNKEETQNIADGAALAGIAAGLVPEPIISKLFAAASGLTSLLAHKALRQNMSLCLVFLGTPGLFNPPTAIYHNRTDC